VFQTRCPRKLGRICEESEPPLIQASLTRHPLPHSRGELRAPPTLRYCSAYEQFE